jgi:hypothetical protein
VADNFTLHEPQLPHSVLVRWEFTHGEPWPIFAVLCPYEAENHDKPCRIWSDEYDNGVYQDGCWVQQSLDASGVECWGLTIPDGSDPPWLTYVFGSGEDGPQLVHADLVTVPCTTESEVDRG